MNQIFGIVNDIDASIILLERLQDLERKQGPFDEVGMATVMAGQIKHHHARENWLGDLQNKPLFGQISIAYTSSQSPEEGATESTLCANDDLAVVFQGILDNPSEIRNALLELGYSYPKTEAEHVLNLLSRYLYVADISPSEAMTLALTRLKGRFSIMALFAKADLFMVARRGSTLAFSVHDNTLYFSSNTQALTTFSKKIIELEEGTPAILRSVKQG